MAPFLCSPPPNLVRAEKAAVAAGVRRSGRFTLWRTASGRIGGTPRSIARTGASAAGQIEKEQHAQAEQEERERAAKEEEAHQEKVRQAELEDDGGELTPMGIKVGVQQRWRERIFLASYVLDAIVCAAYDQVLSPKPQGSKRPVLLVPGWCGRTRSFRKMAERLAAEGYPVYPVPLGSQLGCIDRKASLLSKFLDLHGLEDVYVVAHSMGGLISVRSMMKGETRIRRLITMGTPYRGTHVIYLGYLVTLALVFALSFWLSPLAGTIYLALFMQIPSLWQMQPSSGFLSETLEYLSRVATPVQCVYAVRDQIVIHNWRQAWSPTRLGRGDDLCLPEYGHMNLFMGPSGIELVTRLLARYEATPAAAAAAAPAPAPAPAPALIAAAPAPVSEMRNEGSRERIGEEEEEEEGEEEGNVQEMVRHRSSQQQQQPQEKQLEGGDGAEGGKGVRMHATGAGRSSPVGRGRRRMAEEEE